MKSFSYTELDMLAGEVLPERAVLSTLLVGGGDENENANLNVNHGGEGDDSTVVSSCSANSNQPTTGLLTLLNGTPAANSQICTPAAITG
ncbi:hypothetical protein [Actinomadura algeriensis]|uniref:Uncharacterized protein n=1 Tax=Actinomadura algeriensis TaxID=1679523 RepID=A0ABR9JKH8_9ACTN|nr:hypothetical protein [Actinomadura algeriensis]MBE1530896.1 hypothetical protein [Actinomadura algeriensis]